MTADVATNDVFSLDGVATTFTSTPSSPVVAVSASAPVSPSRSPHSIPFYWEESPGTPKRHQSLADDFDFDFGHPPTDAAASADELFDGGVIRPLKPPPRLHPASAASSPKLSPRTPRWSPRSRAKKPDEFDPFERALVETTRGRAVALGGVGSGRRAARSLSPFRGMFGCRVKVGEVAGEVAGRADQATVGRSGSWKWRLKDLLLFRSKSEGRVAGNRNKDVLRKYTATPATEDVRNSSFRSVESSGSGRRLGDRGASIGGSSRMRLSSHELHYTSKRAASEEEKKKTFLPYRQGLLGCLGFAPTMPVHDLAKSFGSVGGHRS